MHDMGLNKFYDFIPVIYSMINHHTKVEYFSEHILFIIIYLLQEYELNPNKYFEQEINMNIFSQVTEYEVYMYANIQCINMYRYL
jgi:hypothetical protein